VDALHAVAEHVEQRPGPLALVGADVEHGQVALTGIEAQQRLHLAPRQFRDYLLAEVSRTFSRSAALR
jgi:hypothetical protein